MIFDADTHIAPTGGAFTLERHLERLDNHGIARSLTWLKPDYDGEEIAGHNRYIHDAARAHPDRIVPFGWADPTVSVAHAREMVRLCLDEYGFPGVKMNGAQNDYFIDDPEIAIPIAEEIARHGAMIAFHIGPDAYEQTHPLRAEKIARLFPDTPILMVHMGMGNAQMNEAVLRSAAICPNMHLVASATTYQLIRRAIQEIGADRVLFGSDAPFKSTAVEIATCEALLADEFTPRDRDLVMGGNASRLFELA
jgi:predicted TIM-barrel fold metal-dependent hydrolase